MKVVNNNIIVQSATTNCGKLCEKILRALPDWFGIEDSLVQYVKDADIMPTILAKDEDSIMGFLTIKRHFPESADIHCMGILPKYHRTGTGRILIQALENHLKDEGVKILQVKTVSADRNCDTYAKSRAFYKAVGFIPLEVFPTLWDEANPCLVLVKAL